MHPKLELAARLDAEGRHDDAINAISEATAAGVLDAMFLLGKRLFVGDRAPYLPREAAGFLFEAATKGHPDAIALIAVFQATGIYQRKSWQDAITTLAHAADLGHQSAREQLLLLGKGPVSVADTQPSMTSVTNWKQFGSTINLAAWFQVPPGAVICRDPVLMSFPAFIPQDLCKRMIGQSRTRLRPALVYDAVNKRDIHSGTRTNSVAQYNLVENELLHFVLQERMSAACGVPMANFEATAILHYKPGEQIHNHYDFVNTDLPDYDREIAENGQRVITFLLYLNDDYGGGETAFPKLAINHKGRAGEGFFFSNALADGSPDHRVLHAGCPPSSGEKWVVSQFIRNRTVKYIVQ